MSKNAVTINPGACAERVMHFIETREAYKAHFNFRAIYESARDSMTEADWREYLDIPVRHRAGYSTAADNAMRMVRYHAECVLHNHNNPYRCRKWRAIRFEQALKDWFAAVSAYDRAVGSKGVI